MINPHVYNKARYSPEDGVYIGRPSKFGNPFEIGRDGSRDEVITKFESWLRANPELMESVRRELRGKHLICWCVPFNCHGFVLLKIANEEQPQPLR